MIARRLMIVGLLMTSGLPRAAEAQTIKAWEVSGGYAFVRDPRSDLDFPLGWTVGVAGQLNQWLSAVAEIDDSRRTIPTGIGDLRFSVSTYMVGARASAKLGRFVEFGQVLAGVVRSSGTAFDVTTSSTHVGARAGAGLDYPVGKKLAVRGEIDVRLIKGDENGGNTGHQFRLVAGVAYRLF